MPNNHAKLSASHSHVWLHCTRAIKASEGIIEKASEYAEEGTLAHSLAETMLLKEFGQITTRKYNSELKKIKESKYYCEEMQKYIDEYVDFVIEQYNRFDDAEIHMEQRLDYSQWAEGGFGTGDVCIASEGHFTIIDLKYGAGTAVPAKDNPQLKLYGLGLISAFDYAYGLGDVEMIIYQPRIDNISFFKMSADDLLKWGEEVVKPKAEEALAGTGEFCPGDWCSKYYCKARHTCRARAEEAIETAKKVFEDDLLTEEEFADCLSKADSIAKWCEDIKKFALEKLLDGEEIKGWKLVEGRSLRKITDEAKLVRNLTSAGYDEALLYVRKMLGISDLEKLTGKKAFAELSQGCVEKPRGKATLAPESDKRPAYSKVDQAKEAFSDEE